MKEVKMTTQQILNKIEDIKKNGNWIESPFRQLVWTLKHRRIDDNAEDMS